MHTLFLVNISTRPFKPIHSILFSLRRSSVISHMYILETNIIDLDKVEYSKTTTIPTVLLKNEQVPEFSDAYRTLYWVYSPHLFHIIEMSDHIISYFLLHHSKCEISTTMAMLKCTTNILLCKSAHTYQKKLFRISVALPL